MKKSTVIILVLVGAFVLYAYIANPTPTTPSSYVGDTVSIIAGPNGDEIPVATTKEVDDEFAKVLYAKDEHGYKQLFASGKMFRVDRGTKALIIERSYAMAQVRILEGVHEGKAGWVPIEFAVKQGAAEKTTDGKELEVIKLPSPK